MASSRIEQLTSTARKVMEAELLGASQRNAGLIVAATSQMNEAIQSTETPTVDSILTLHQLLLETSARTLPECSVPTRSGSETAMLTRSTRSSSPPCAGPSP